MPKVRYVDIAFSPARLAVIDQANRIIEEYAAQGFDLTLRQLYYQFVSRDLIPNRQQEYKRLGDIVNDGRLAGLIDWNSITDRTRNLRALPHWSDPAEIVSSAAAQFRVDKWGSQPHRVEVWIEKDALVGVIEGVCHELDVPYFSCRGYTSQSEMWAAAQRILAHTRRGQEPVVLHLGDHDPSGIDMSRDIQDRLELFTGGRVLFVRLALNRPQVEQYAPPPNPAKTTDSRYNAYIREHGDESWELDALEPSVIADLIRAAVASFRVVAEWREEAAREEKGRRLLGAVTERWAEVERLLQGGA